MSIELDHLEVKRGESVIVKLDGSTERSVSVYVTRNGLSLLHGPWNVNRKWWRLSIEGWTELPEADALKLLGE